MAQLPALLSRPAREQEAGQVPLAPLASDGQAVPLVQGGSARWVNLDYAASAPALRAVADHVAQVLPLYASVHRGARGRGAISSPIASVRTTFSSTASALG